MKGKGLPMWIRDANADYDTIKARMSRSYKCTQRAPSAPRSSVSDIKADTERKCTLN